MTTSSTNPNRLDRPVSGGVGRFVRVDDSMRLAAVERLVAAGAAASRMPPDASGTSIRAHAERFLEFSAANSIKIEAMWASLDERDRVLATVLAVPNPGRTAIVFASGPVGPSAVAEHASLIDHVCGQLTEMDVDLAQVLIEPRENRQREAFLGGGFHELAKLGYMERPLPGSRRIAPPEWPAGVTLESYSDRLEPEVLDVLMASYEDTLDCPGLRGLRKTEDIFAGHIATGEFDPALWTLLREDGRARGVLMLNCSPASNAIELVYIGLAKSIRGRGLGGNLLRHGLRLIASRPERAITLAVDEQNHGAIALYRGHGFRRVLRRVALIRSIPAATGP